jgi:predicted enzyme related to lactoylglutathione lyase
MTGYGRFVWYDLMTPDQATAEQFYMAVLGWETDVWKQNGSPSHYTMWTANKIPIGGIMAMPADAIARGERPHWLAYVSTPDTDAMVRQATGLGASVVVPPTDIPGVGRFAMLTDPVGAFIAPFTPNLPAGVLVEKPPVGHFSWHELATSDPAGAFAFYHATCGWAKTDAMDMGPDGTYQMFGWPAPSIGGIYGRPADQKGPTAWLHYIRVADVDRAVAVVQAKGGKLCNSPMEVPGGSRIAQCQDPQGAAFALHESTTFPG